VDEMTEDTEFQDCVVRPVLEEIMLRAHELEDTATCLLCYVTINEKLINSIVGLFGKLLDSREEQMLVRWRNFIDTHPDYVEEHGGTLRQTIEESFSIHDTFAKILQESFRDTINTLQQKSLATLSSKARFEEEAARRLAVKTAILCGSLGLVEIAKSTVEIIRDGETVVRGAFDPAGRDAALVTPIAESIEDAEIEIRRRLVLAYRVTRVLYRFIDVLDAELSNHKIEWDSFGALPTAEEMRKRLTKEFDLLENEGSLKRYDKRVEPITFID